MILDRYGRPLSKIQQQPGGEKALGFTDLLIFDANANRSPYNQRQLARESYTQTPYTFRAVNLVAKALSSIPVLAERSDGEPVEEHPALDLLKRPNSRQGRIGLFESLVAYRKLAGQAFLLVLRQGNGRGQPLAGGVYSLRPDAMKVIFDDDRREIERFIYTPGDGDPQVFGTNEVLMLGTWNPLDEGNGMSEVIPAAGAVDQLNHSQTWNNSLLRNGGKPSAVILAKRNLSAQQKAQITDWSQQQYGGPTNAGRFAVIEGTDLEWHELGMNARDLDYIEGRKMSAVEVALAHGVPPELLGIQGQKTYSNYAEARKALYVETVKPEMEVILDELNAWLLPMYGESDVQLVADYSAVEELQADMQAEYARISTAFEAGWMTVNDARREAGLEELGDDLDVFSWQVRTGPTMPPAAPSDEEGDEEDEQTPPAPPEQAAAAQQLDTKALTADEASKKLSGPLGELRGRIGAKVAMLTDEHFDRMAEGTLASLKAGGDERTTVELVLEALGEDKTYAEGMGKLYRDTVEDVARAGDRTVKAVNWLDALGPLFAGLTRSSGGSVDAALRAADDFIIEALARDLAFIQQTTRRDVLKAIETGLRRGDTLEDIARGIEITFVGAKRVRTPRIVQTESLTFSNSAVDQVANALGAPRSRVWVSQEDALVRETHSIAHGQRVSTLADFTVGGFTARYPGDPWLPPAERANCRCFALYDDVQVD